MVYNRPEQTRRVVSALRSVKPQRLFVAADGPRADRPDDAERCAASRRVLAQIDWDCDIKELFQDSNLGCKRGVETAVSWFFSQVSDGIILEDDCVPTVDFFPFCAELLDRFAENERVMMIGGHNPLGAWSSATGPSYLFSRTCPIWGWATWRRAWQLYDPQMTDWASRDGQQAVRARMPAAEFRMTRRRFDHAHSGGLDTWGFVWAFAILRTGGVSVVPAQNMISNIGFGADATHTKNPWSSETHVPTGRIGFPLAHPDSVKASDELDAAQYAHQFPLTRRLMTMLPVGISELIRSIVYRMTANVGGRESSH